MTALSAEDVVDIIAEAATGDPQSPRLADRVEVRRR